ncbi:MAG: hypothetical protein NVSMB9_05300 [Isosphaeraceae bacterium]
MFGLGMSLFAIGLSYANGRNVVNVSLSPPRYYGVNGSAFERKSDDNYLFDTVTGRLNRLDDGEGKTVEYATCSPWAVETGVIEVMGRIRKIAGGMTLRNREDSDVLGFKFSEGPWSDQGEERPVITGYISWIVDDPTRIHFVAGDGHLYVQDLPRGDDSVSAEDLRSPRAVTWQCKTPGQGLLFITDAVSPVVPALRGRVFVSIRRGELREGRMTYGTNELWWLKLDREGRSIVSAGCLSRFSSWGNAASPADERLPNLALTPDGRVVLAYLKRIGRTPNLCLMVALIDIDSTTGDPSVGCSGAVQLTKNCATTKPLFSPDGRWVYGISQSDVAGGPALRFSLDQVLNMSGSSESRSVMKNETSRSRPNRDHRAADPPAAPTSSKTPSFSG